MLDLADDPHTQEEVSDAMGIDKWQIRHILERGLKKLGHKYPRVGWDTAWHRDIRPMLESQLLRVRK